MRKLHAGLANFASDLANALASRNADVADVAPVVQGILADVKSRGDEALLQYTSKFDQVPATNANELVITKKQAEAAFHRIDKKLGESLMLAASRIRAYHEAQRPEDHRYTDEAGITLGWKYQPISAVGLYVPGGKASYPSSVLMNAIPAKVAGVERLAMVVPTPKGVVNDVVLAAAYIAGVDEIYAVGGAQAVAALAYGTGTIAPVKKIVGPGNAYVAEAKRQVFGVVGIDTIAGPSEVLVVADNKNDPRWIAVDLLSQAEHDEQAQAVLVTNDEAFADAVIAAVEAELETLPSAAIARASWNAHGLVIVVKHLADAYPIIAHVAPEHLELAIDEPELFAQKVTNAGAIFMGRHFPEAVGDYIAGPSHVLPTSGAASFASGLSVFDFLTRTSMMGATHESVQPLLAAASIMADAEGLPAHALSLRLREKGSA